MRIHLVGLPHTNTTRDYEWCAYTAKTRKFADMMAADHNVFLYSGPENEAQCVEHIACIDELPPNGEIPDFSPDNRLFRQFNNNAIAEIGYRLEPGDFICLIGGFAQGTIAEAFHDRPTQIVEYGIGYGGVLPTTHWVFESYSWMHAVYGAQTRGNAHAANGRFYDAVVPNYFDVSDFPPGRGDGNYLLYVGRLIERKGLQIALDVSEAMDIPLVVAGSGDFPLPDWVDYRGVVGPQERAELMGGAIAQLVPTLYVEPFGGVAVEAQLTGTPVITTDWGAFTETVSQGETGFRCRTLGEFCEAVDDAEDLDRNAIRQHAIDTYSLEAIKPRYEQYFTRLQTLWGDGFYTLASQ